MQFLYLKFVDKKQRKILTLSLQKVVTVTYQGVLHVPIAI